MKLRKYLLSLLLPIVCIFALTACKENEVEKASKNLSTYTINIDYKDDHTLSCRQTLNYRNNTDTSLERLKMHLYPRSFRQGAKTSVVSSLNYDKCYFNGASFGDIEITKLDVNNEPKDIVINGNDEDVLDIAFTENLQPNATNNIYIEYIVTLPNISHRFGYGNDTINLGNFYPIACMYENGDFVIDSYHYNGDPFYSECANYNVTINCNSKYTVASTGNLIEEHLNNDTKSQHYKALTVRDFAIVLSDKFTVVSDNINNVQVNYYYYKNKYPNEAIKTSVDSIRTFSELFGNYPYKTMNVVESNFVHGGMEYPNIVLISDEVDKQEDYLNVIVHEIAHQWWYGVVGNNEVNFGWLDEGLTEYSTILFYEANPQYNINTKELIKNTTNSYVTFVEIYKKVFSDVDTTMNRKLNEYNNESEYVYIAYVKGMLLFDNFREVLGKDKFLKCLQTYFKDNKFQIATPDSLINSFEKCAGCSLRNIFESWINGKVKIMEIN